MRNFPAKTQPAYGSTAKKSSSLSNQSTRPTLAQFLPSTGRAFFVYLIGLLIFCGCLAFYIQLSVQILQAEAVLYQKEAAYHEVNQQNTHIIWRVSQASTLTRVQERAAELEYKSDPSQLYIQASTLPAVAQLPTPNNQLLVTSNQLPATSNQQPATSTPATWTLRIQTFIEAATRYISSWQQPDDYQANQS